MEGTQVTSRSLGDMRFSPQLMVGTVRPLGLASPLLQGSTNTSSRVSVGSGAVEDVTPSCRGTLSRPSLPPSMVM